MSTEKAVEVDNTTVSSEEDFTSEVQHEEIVASKDETSNVKSESKGFQTYEEWVASGKDPDMYKGRKAYIKEGETYAALIGLQKENKNIKKAMADVAEFVKTVEESSYKKAREELKLEAMRAAERMDVEAVGAITDKITELEATRKVSEQNKAAAQKNDDSDDVNDASKVIINTFYESHPWMMSDKSEDQEKIAFTYEEDARIKKEMPNISIQEHFRLLTNSLRVYDKTKETTKTTDSKKKLSPVVGSGDIASGGTTKAGYNYRALFSKLPAHHQNIIKQIKASGAPFSSEDLEKYVKNYEATKK